MEQDKALMKKEQDERVVALIKQWADQEGIPPTGITLMGGKPYINVTGLDVKLRTKCEKEGKEHISTESIRIVEPTQENGYLVGYHATIKLFDKDGYMKALGKVKEASVEALKELKETFTETFSAEGFASPKTCEGIGWRYTWVAGRKQKTDMLLENIIMMAERRATNRAKREATGTGLTSLDELPLETPTEEVIEESGEQPPKNDEKLYHTEIENDTFSQEVGYYVSRPSFKEWCRRHAIYNMKDVKSFLKVYFNTKNLKELTTRHIMIWQNYVTKTGTKPVEVKPNDTGHREDVQRPEDYLSDNGVPEQGELVDDSDPRRTDGTPV
jgi:hypothetical protein